MAIYQKILQAQFDVASYVSMPAAFFIRHLLVSDPARRPNLFSLLQPGTYLPIDAIGTRSPLLEFATRRASKPRTTAHAGGSIDPDPFRANPQIDFSEELLFTW